jgi:hypothetical protein
VLPLLETLTELLYQDNLQSCYQIFSNTPDVLKFLFIQSGLSNSGNSKNSLQSNLQRGSVPVQQYTTGQLYAINSLIEGA